MQRADIKERVRGFIVKHFARARSRAFSDDAPLLENGILDSMGVLELVNYLEEELKIGIADEDLIMQNFRTVEDIAAFVEGKITGRSGQAP